MFRHDLGKFKIKCGLIGDQLLIKTKITTNKLANTEVYNNLQNSKFIKINEKFTCENCGKSVPEAKSTCRDHCPFCLYSKHVDINPGDRANDCHGLLQPIGYHRHKKKGWMIEYRCNKCLKLHRNIAILEDEIEPDSYDQLLSLSSIDK